MDSNGFHNGQSWSAGVTLLELCQIQQFLCLKLQDVFNFKPSFTGNTTEVFVNSFQRYF